MRRALVLLVLAGCVVEPPTSQPRTGHFVSAGGELISPPAVWHADVGATCWMQQGISCIPDCFLDGGAR